MQKSLNVHVSWQRVLTESDVRLENSALPLSIRCSSCDSNRMKIFDDFVLGGQWHYCNSCGTCGDMIELASKLWSLDITATLKKLEGLGCRFPEPVSAFTVADYKKHIEYRTRVNQFWVDCQTNVSRKAAYSKLFNKLYIRRGDISPTWREEVLGRLIGGSTRDAVEELFHPISGTSYDGGVKHTSRKVFTGSDWKDILVFPFCDMPGRICSFFFIGRDCRPEYDTAYRHINTKGDRLSDREAGLFYHPQLIEKKASIVYAVSDHLLAAKMIAKNAALKQRPAPVVGWYQDTRARTQLAWNTFHDRRIIFWDEELSADMLRQAIAADADVCTGRFLTTDPKRMANMMQKMQVREFLRGLEKRAVHWSQVLGRIAGDMRDEELENLLLNLQLDADATNVVLSHCKGYLKNRIEHLLVRQTGGLVIRIDSKKVEERDTGWYLLSKDGEELISDGLLRIDKVISHRREGVAFYQGRVLYKGAEYPFCVDKETLDKNPLAWMQEHLLDAQAGLMNYNASWSRKVVAMATRIQSPSFVKGDEQVGWDKDQSTFVLPRFRIEFGGKVLDNSTMIITSTTPAALLSRPDVVAPAEIDLLTKNDNACRLFWSNWCCLVANIVAPAINRDTRGIVVSGTMAANMASLALSACGCQSHENPKKKTKIKEIDYLTELERKHLWPVGVFMEGTRRGGFVKEFIIGDSNRNCMVRANAYQTLSAILNGGWHAIVDDKISDWDSNAILHSRSFLPAFLQTITAARFRNNSENSAVKWVFQRTISWLKKLGVDPQVVRDAYKRVIKHSEDGHANVFGELLCKLYMEGLVEIGPKGFKKTNTVISRITKPRGLFIPKSLLATILASKEAAPVSSAAITRHLMKASVLVGETEIDDTPGWVVDDKWLEAILHKSRMSGQLKVQ
jgi:hypothetical protein